MLLLKLTVVALVTTVAVLLPLATAADGAFDAVKHDTEKTLFLFVEATQENRPALSNLENDLTSVSNYIDPSWFNQFVVISFDTSGIKTAAGFSTIEEARVALASIAENPLPSNDGGDLPLLRSVIHGLSSFTFNPQSVVYLITTTGSAVSDQVNGPTLFKALLGWQVQLQYILINSTQGNHSLSTQSTRFVADLAVTTGGNFMKLSSGNLITSYISAHLPTLYDSAFIGDATQGSFTCVQTTYYAAIEPNVGTVYLYLYSIDANLNVNGQYNDVFLKTLFEDGHAGIFSFLPVDGPGIYTVSVKGVGACSLQIRAQSAPASLATTQIPSTTPLITVYSTTTTSAFTGTTPSDASTPIVTTESVATSVVSDPSLYESTTTYINESTTTSLVTAPTPAGFTESTPSGSTSSDTAASTVSIAITESTVPTTSGYYDAEFDVIFVLDIHRTSSPMILINFVNNTLLNFNLNGKINLAVNGLGEYPVFDKFFIPIRGPSDINDALVVLYEVYQSFTNQSNLAGVLGELYNFEYPGYRPKINNHLIVYTTINGTAESDAITIGNEIINNGTYSIVAVTSESNESNIPSLTALVGGKSECVITTNDWTITAAEKLANLIRKASNNNGIYC
uniref:VWFA domain-containing protein n=1 Tax=Panagrellus redivivus TaxID=6233 RepID=A0A7E4WCU6_PANRE